MNVKLFPEDHRTRAIITRSWSFSALEYKPRILGLKIKNFIFLVHKLSVVYYSINRSTIKTAVKNGVKNIQAAAYNGVRTV